MDEGFDHEDEVVQEHSFRLSFSIYFKFSKIFDNLSAYIFKAPARYCSFSVTHLNDLHDCRKGDRHGRNHTLPTTSIRMVHAYLQQAVELAEAYFGPFQTTMIEPLWENSERSKVIDNFRKKIYYKYLTGS